MAALVHTDMLLYDCYIREVLRSTPSLSEPVGYMDVVFHVPIQMRADIQGREGRPLEDSRYAKDAVDMAIRHYVEKRGHPGRDIALKIAVVVHPIGEEQPGKYGHFIRLND